MQITLTMTWQQVAAAGSTVEVQNLTTGGLYIMTSAAAPAPGDVGIALVNGDNHRALALTQNLWARAMNAGGASLVLMGGFSLGSTSGGSTSPTLGTLTLSPTTGITAGTAYSGTIAGNTAGSTIAATSSDGTALTVSGTTISGTFATGGSKTITLVETLANATGNPKSTTIAINVAAAPAVNGFASYFFPPLAA